MRIPHAKGVFPNRLETVPGNLPMCRTTKIARLLKEWRVAASFWGDDTKVIVTYRSLERNRTYAASIAR